MIEPLPKTSVFTVRGTLSSSTQMYSGSLGTSPNRGFLMSSQRVSALLSVTLGSSFGSRPASERMVEVAFEHPAPVTATMTRAIGHHRITGFIRALYLNTGALVALKGPAGATLSRVKAGGSPWAPRAGLLRACRRACRGRRMIVGGPAPPAVSTWRRASPSRTTPAICVFSVRLVAAGRPGTVAVTGAIRERLTQPFAPCVETTDHGNSPDSEDGRSVLDRRLPGEALLLRGLRPGQHLPPREERGPRDRRDPRRVQVRDAAAPEQHRDEPPRDVEGLALLDRLLRLGEELFHARGAAAEEIEDREGVGDLEALGAIERGREEERHPAQVRVGLGQVDQRRDRNLDPPPRDPYPVLDFRRRLAVDRDELRRRKLRLDPEHVGVAEHVLVPAERLAGEGMAEDVPLSEDRELLPDLDLVLRGEVQVERRVVHGDDDALARLERLHELGLHEPERGADPVGEAGPGRRGHDPEREGHEGRAGPQNETDGWWTPNTARSRSQISPSVADAATASRISGIRLTRPRAAASRRSRARSTRSGSRAARSARRRAASASPTRGSTWNRLDAGASSVTNSLTPTTTRSRASISIWYRYAASWISRCMKPIACIEPPMPSIFAM